MHLDQTRSNCVCLCRFTNQAAFVGDAAIAELLLDKGANAAAPKEDGGMTPLLLGCLRGHLAVAKVLIEKRGLDCLFLNDVQGLSPVFVHLLGSPSLLVRQPVQHVPLALCEPLYMHCSGFVCDGP
jgi:hypothetical protein